MSPNALNFVQFYQNFFAINDSNLKSPKKISILILAPHPDDECLMASVPLRLMIENKARTTACAVTLGSNITRQDERKQEFIDSCTVLGFEPLMIDNDWDEKFHTLEKIITSEKINLIVAPHLNDHHPVHIKTSELARTLIAKSGFNGVLLESEFWGELVTPNLLVEVTKEVFVGEFDALTKHVGEVSRNPYHLRLAANLVNNVRRGAEKVVALGAKSPGFAFGNLYHAYRAENGSLTLMPPQILNYESDISLIF